ncbi:MAG: polymer-forming cytoskeletal protein, partial [Lachnospiraceae bacterium]|nr:polymer-forming cytoskeletal protein [Lachnospiraceae bacterium]
MGFFSDLKEDLSQAVNELMPEEELDAAKAGNPETESVVSAEQYVQDTTVTEEVPETVNSLDISSMLDKLDEMDTVEETEQEAAVIPEVSEETTEGTSWTGFYATAENGSEPEDAEIPEETVTEETVMEEEEPLPAVEEEAAATATEETEMEADNILSQPDEEEEKTMDVQINRVAVDETAVVTEGMTITGDIKSEGSMELIGTVNGNLDIFGKLNITGTIQGNSKAAEIYAEGANVVGEVNSDGSVKIGQSSVIIGNISATSAVIAGAVKGDIDVHGPVILDTTAIVMG